MREMTRPHHTNKRIDMKAGMQRKTRIGRMHWLFGTIFIVAILVIAALSTVALREREIEDWRNTLRSTSFLLAEHTSHTIFAAYLILDSITDRVEHAGIADQASFRAKMATPEVYAMLREKIRGLPQVDVASIVAANGDNINFTRSYPVPPINLADRDYFRAQEKNPHLGDFISQAVRNRGNGKWTFYISRRLDDAQGNFMGLALVGLSVNAFTDIYENVVRNLGNGATITLYRSDLKVLAHAPRNENLIGKVNHSGSTYHVIVLRQKKQDVLLTSDPGFATGQARLRLSAVRMTDRYPLVVTLMVPADLFLASWRHSAMLIAGVSLLAVIIVFFGISILTGNLQQRERAQEELAESETKFHTMVDWTADWEYWVKPDGTIHYMTPSAERITGYRAEEFDRNPALIDSLVHPEDRPLWKEHVNLYQPGAPSNEVAQLDIRIIQKNGRPRWLSHTCRPVLSASGEYLGRRINMQDITDRKAAENEIRKLAFFDSLTKLPNRRLLFDRLDQAMTASKRSQEYGSLMMLDIDNFKKLNDTHGHNMGDLLLLEVARRLTATVRESDTISRLGGDEFVVLIEGLGKEEQLAADQAAQVAEKIRGALDQPYHLGESGMVYHSTSSLGLTRFRGRDTSIVELLKEADMALYEAKESGRNTVRLFKPAKEEGNIG